MILTNPATAGPFADQNLGKDMMNSMRFIQQLGQRDYCGDRSAQTIGDPSIGMKQSMSSRAAQTARDPSYGELLPAADFATYTGQALGNVFSLSESV